MMLLEEHCKEAKCDYAKSKQYVAECENNVMEAGGKRNQVSEEKKKVAVKRVLRSPKQPRVMKKLCSESEYLDFACANETCIDHVIDSDDVTNAINKEYEIEPTIDLE
eukprot:14671728-Ditylum_brightwellii.AAC.1